MTVLPIVGRELRVTARRSATYWLRAGMAGGATVIGSCILLVTLDVQPQKVGYSIFLGLSGLALLFALFYGRHATADCLSSEKRQGTLGLLFLTDLKGYDVVLGKLAATSMAGFHALLALFPVLAIPLLLGGITSGEFWRVVLMLVNTFLFSLSVGIFASSLTWDARKALGTNLFVLLLVIGIPPAISIAVAGVTSRTPVLDWFLSCPMYTFYLALDRTYAASPWTYWRSLALLHALTWLMLSLASRFVLHGWQDRPVQTKNKSLRSRWRRLSYGSDEGQRAFRDQALGINAFFWLAGRAYLKPLHVWAFICALAVWWIVGWATAGRTWFDIATYLVTAALLNTTLKIWLMIEASQKLAEEHQAGTLELLLSTRLTVKDIVQGQWLALRRQFARPLIAVALIELGFLYLCLRLTHGDPWIIPVWLASICMLLVDMVAGGWLAMWLALKVKKPHQAAFGAVVRLLITPWLLLGAISGVRTVWYNLVLGSDPEKTWAFNLLLWIGLGLAADVCWGLVASAKLLHNFRELALQHLTPAARLTRKLATPPAAKPAKAAPVPTTKDSGGPIRPRFRKPLVAAVALILALVVLKAIGVFPWNSLAPPLVVTANGNAPIHVGGDNSGLLIALPDGSLWAWSAARSRGRPAKPQWTQLGRGQKWRKAIGTYNDVIALRDDGTLWQWKRQGTDFSDETQLNSQSNWVDMASLFSGTYGAAISRDGGLSEWGSHSTLNRLRRFDSTEPQKLDSESGWKTLSGNLTMIMAIKNDGSLWIWGMIPPAAPGAFSGPITVPTPARLCRETNWIGFLQGYPVLPINSKGEVWEMLGKPPDSQAPAGAVCRLLATNAQPGRIAMVYSPNRKICQIRQDGTLWEKELPAGRTFAPGSEWIRVGRRKDWVNLFAVGPTAVGLTRDGTVWMWGYDPTGTGRRDLLRDLRSIQVNIGATLGSKGPTPQPGMVPSYQKQPRPLMVIKKGNAPN